MNVKTHRRGSLLLFAIIIQCLHSTVRSQKHEMNDTPACGLTLPGKVNI